MFSWGDTSSVEWSPYYVSGQNVVRTRVYPDSGNHCVRVRARDSKAAESEWSDSLIVSVGPVPPSVPARPWGAKQWLRNYPFPCTTVTTDPESSAVAYQFDWGDGAQSGWSQVMPSGYAYSDTHSYAQGGSYSIRARAANENLVSGWSEQFSLTVSSNTPPAAPLRPWGDTVAERGVPFACTTRTVVPRGDQITYQFDWGDNTRSQWSPLMGDGVPWADTHSYAVSGVCGIKARVKVGEWPSAWSEALDVSILAHEGCVLWSLGFTDPENPADSADFSLNTFAIGSDNTVYIACDYGAIIARKPSGSIWKLVLPNLDKFTAAPVLADDGTILIGCSNDSVYALNPDGTVKWADSVGGQVWATGALGADGTAYFQTADSMVLALRSDGTTAWTFPSGGGNSAPVVGADGTVYAVNQDGMVYAINPADGSQKWTYNLSVPSVQAPAIDPSRNRLYVVSGAGALQSVDLTTGVAGYSYTAGQDASGPVVGPDGSVFISGGGVLTKLSPDFDKLWTFTPPLSGVLSTPALTVEGYLCVLVVAGRKRLALQGTDSLYAVNPDGTRRWACGLGEGLSDPRHPLSAPKIDPSGLIYVGDGFRAWCVVGVSAPAMSIWPTFQHDAQNSGRAR